MIKKNISLIFIGFFSVLLLANWGSTETTVDNLNKQAINFAGTLTTQQDQVYDIENIAIGRKYEQIPFYEMQQKNNASPASAQKELTNPPCPPCTKEEPYRLKNNPRDGIITKINLADVSEIRVPTPDTVWVYQQKRKGRKTEYIEIIVTFKNSETNKEMSFLADLHRKISCDRADATNKSIELEVPFKAVKSLLIKSYHHRKDEDNDQREQLPQQYKKTE